jgi:pimeloyl-ACP methyl ester carboxylesterase
MALLRPSPALDRDRLAATLPRGDGHAVLVLPPALRGDGLTAALRAVLGHLGFLPFGWGLGPNLGPTSRLLAGASARVSDLAGRYGPVSLIGFSMGGLFARLLAHRQSERVRRLVTVGSPFRNPLGGTILPVRPFFGFWDGPAAVRRLVTDIAVPPDVPTTSLYSREDGIVDWRCCTEPGGDNVEFAGPHMTMVHSETVLRIIAERLARPIPVPGRAAPSRAYDEA